MNNATPTKPPLLLLPPEEAGARSGLMIPLVLLEERKKNTAGKRIGVSFNAVTHTGLLRSAERAAEFASRLLSAATMPCEGSEFIYQSISPDVPQTDDRGTELLFALQQVAHAYAAAFPSFAPPCFAAAGTLEAGGRIGAVRDVEARLYATCRVATREDQPRIIFIPAANAIEGYFEENEEGRWPRIVPVEFLHEALVELGIVLPLGGMDIVRLLQDGTEIDAASEAGQALLGTAVSTGDLQTVRHLLASGASPDARNKAGLSPLMLAAKHGRMDCIRLLLQLGADVDARYSLQRTPLMYAATRGNAEMAELLLDHGANVEAKDDEQATVLAYAAKYGHLDIARILCKRGAQVDAMDERRYTPLVHAAKEGRLEVARLLLDLGAGVEGAYRAREPADMDRKGWSPLITAIRNGHATRDVTPLMMAAGNGHTDIVRLLLDRNANVHARDIDGSVLIRAARHGNAEIVRLLLGEGAKANERDLGKDGTPLVWAIRGKGRHDVIQALLDGGADANANDEDGTTALMVAARFSDLETLRILLENGADVHARDRFGLTPLMFAVPGSGKEEQCLEVVRLLVAKGAHVNARCYSHISRSDRPWGFTPAMPLLSAVQYRKLEIARFLLENGAEANAIDSDGRMALAEAAGKGDMDMVQLLLDAGADVNATGTDGVTPLSSAIRNGREEVAQFLRDRGALAGEQMGQGPDASDAGQPAADRPSPATISGSSGASPGATKTFRITNRELVSGTFIGATLFGSAFLFLALVVLRKADGLEGFSIGLALLLVGLLFAWVTATTSVSLTIGENIIVLKPFGWKKHALDDIDSIRFTDTDPGFRTMSMRVHAWKTVEAKVTERDEAEIRKMWRDLNRSHVIKDQDG